MNDEAGEVTRWIRAIQEGQDDAWQNLMPLLHQNLRRLAAHHMAGERADHTLQPTALVHEAFIRMVGETGFEAHNRFAFLAHAGEAMRRVLIDHARRRRACKRGGPARPLPLEGLDVPIHRNFRQEDYLALDEALTRLARKCALKAQIFEWHFFGGLTFAEIGAHIGRSADNARYQWRLAEADISSTLRGHERH